MVLVIGQRLQNSNKNSKKVLKEWENQEKKVGGDLKEGRGCQTMRLFLDQNFDGKSLLPVTAFIFISFGTEPLLNGKEG